MNINQIVAEVPDYQVFFSLDEMKERTDRLCNNYPDAITRTAIGKSRFGIEIEMISIGHGKHSVMVVGAPHPHELVGTLTADFLLTFFCEQPAFLLSTDATWHFIKAIDPDGVMLNSPWLAQPLSPSNYFSSFFRPPLWRQAEFTFPFAFGEHRFSGSTPENKAWEKALIMTKPDLLYSTHNCEFGGVFYFTSDGLPELDFELIKLTRKYRLTEDTIGEHGSSAKDGLPSVFTFPDEITESIKEMQLGESNVLMRTGDSSAGYSEKKFGTFSLVAEVPYWCLNKLKRDLDVGFVAEKTTELIVEGEKLVDKFLPLLQHLASKEAQLLLEALDVPRIDDELHIGIQVGNCHSALTELLLALRRPAMLLKLVEVAWRTENFVGAKDMFCVVNQFHRESLAVIEEMDFLLPVPLQQLVQLQIEAVLITLKYLRSQPC